MVCFMASRCCWKLFPEGEMRFINQPLLTQHRATFFSCFPKTKNQAGSTRWYLVPIQLEAGCPRLRPCTPATSWGLTGWWCGEYLPSGRTSPALCTARRGHPTDRSQNVLSHGPSGVKDHVTVVHCKRVTSVSREQEDLWPEVMRGLTLQVEETTTVSLGTSQAYKILLFTVVQVWQVLVLQGPCPSLGMTDRSTGVCVLHLLFWALAWHFGPWRPIQALSVKRPDSSCQLLQFVLYVQPTADQRRLIFSFYRR